MRVKDLADYSYCKRKVYLSKKFGMELLEIQNDNLKFIEDTKKCIKGLDCSLKVKSFVDFIISETDKLSEGKRTKLLFDVNLKSDLISGKIDELIINDEEIIPVKFKMENNNRNVWDSEKIIMIAYAYLVQNDSRFKRKVKTAKIFYADKTVKTIHINELSFKLLREKIRELNSILKKDKPPRISKKRSKCEACSFRRICYSLPY